MQLYHHKIAGYVDPVAMAYGDMGIALFDIFLIYWLYD
jgi:hypothetical protein